MLLIRFLPRAFDLSQRRRSKSPIIKYGSAYFDRRLFMNDSMVTRHGELMTTSLTGILLPETVSGGNV